MLRQERFVTLNYQHQHYHHRRRRSIDVVDVDVDVDVAFVIVVVVVFFVFDAAISFAAFATIAIVQQYTILQFWFHAYT